MNSNALSIKVVNRRARGRLLLAAAALMFGAATAHASCADPRAMRSFQPRITIHAPKGTDSFRGGPVARKIVGTWLVTYETPGAGTAQAYIQWHSDGTEWENINLPLDGGNLCMGSWKEVDHDHVQRNHYGWNYTAGLLTGYFNETETAEVKRDGTYTGVTHMQFFDLSGNSLGESSGTSSAVLITP